MILIIVLLLAITACDKEATPSTDTVKTITVAVSILPQKTFVEKIAGDLVHVVVLVPPGQNPATYQPTTKQLQELSQASLLFTIGVPFEKAFLPVIKKTLPNLRIIKTDETTKKRTFRTSNQEKEEGKKEDGTQKTIDPHIWMSPISVIKETRIMTDALISMDPSHEQIYHDGFTAYEKQLRDLDTELSETLEPLAGSTLLVYHPAFGYFADRYALIQKAIEIGGKEPSPKELEALITEVKSEDVSLIFVQPEFNIKSAQVIADAIHAKVITIAPLNEAYIDNLRHIAQVLKDTP